MEKYCYILVTQAKENGKVNSTMIDCYANYEDAKNLHIEDYLTMKWCKSDFSQDTQNKIYDNIYLRHYITKSWEEYVWKIYVRGMFYPLHRKYDNFFEINEDMKDRKEELMRLADSIIEKYKS